MRTGEVLKVYPRVKILEEILQILSYREEDPRPPLGPAERALEEIADAFGERRAGEPFRIAYPHMELRGRVLRETVAVLTFEDVIGIPREEVWEETDLSTMFGAVCEESKLVWELTEEDLRSLRADALEALPAPVPAAKLTPGELSRVFFGGVGLRQPAVLLAEYLVGRGLLAENGASVALTAELADIRFRACGFDPEDALNSRRERLYGLWERYRAVTDVRSRPAKAYLYTRLREEQEKPPAE